MSADEGLTVVGVQILNQCATNLKMVQENVDRACKLISDHAEVVRKNSSENIIYLLPELSSSGYGGETFKNLEEVAEPANGLSFKCFSLIAKKYRCYISYGFPHKSNGKYFISQGVVSPEGKLLGVYDKLHICQFGYCVEKQYFSSPVGPGEPAKLVVFKVGNFNVGLAICYDVRFPELWRKYALEHQVHLMLHPGGWPRDLGFFTWHTFVTTRAVENQIYVMSNNRASEENGATFFCPPLINQTSKPKELGTEEGLLVGHVSMNFIKQTRSEINYRHDRLSKY